jgi:2-polyprenyl-3-methyl-5-hydroxy-6-metoxy-1,4-benzoquinol methylase
VVDAGESRALDLAGGVGQNGLWLAEQGYSVDILDFSRVALLRAKDEVNRRSVRTVNLYQVDLDKHVLPENEYDLVCVFRYLNRKLFTALRATVKPGGRIIYETFNRHYLDTNPSFNPDYALQDGELAGYFADWRVVYNHDGKRMSSIVAIKTPKETW